MVQQHCLVWIYLSSSYVFRGHENRRTSVHAQTAKICEFVKVFNQNMTEMFTQKMTAN